MSVPADYLWELLVVGPHLALEPSSLRESGYLLSKQSRNMAVDEELIASVTSSPAPISLVVRRFKH